MMQAIAASPSTRKIRTTERPFFISPISASSETLPPRPSGPVSRIAELQKGAEARPGEQLLYVPPSYWKDLAGYDPAATAATLKLPMLVLQGERDYQVTKVDFAGWQKALGKKKTVKLKLYPKLFHLFIAGDGPSTPAEYEKPGHVDEQVVRDIADWISARSSR